MRAESVMDNIKIHLGELFWDWGIPTAVSIIEVRRGSEVHAHYSFGWIA